MPAATNCPLARRASSPTRTMSRRFFVFALSLFAVLTLAGPAFAQATGDFRSVASGDWDSTATWQRFDGADWVGATWAPDSADGAVTVRTGHAVTIGDTLVYDQLVVESGAQVTVGAGVPTTLADGAGTDLQVLGTWVHEGAEWNTAGATWQVSAGGTFVQHSSTDLASALDAATLDPASHFIHRGDSGLAPPVSTSGRAYGRLSFESTSGNWAAVASGTGTLDVAGDFTIGAGVTFTVEQTGTMSFAGDFTNDGTFATGAGTQSFVFSGAGATVGGSGALAFEDVQLDPGVGELALASDLSVSGVLALGANSIVTGASTLSLGSGASLTRTTGRVIGRLSRAVSAGDGAITFDIGDASQYAPVTLSWTGVTSGGELTASSTAGAHPSLGSAALSGSKRVDRWWNLSPSGVAGGTFDATFHFGAGELVGGADTSRLVVGKFDSPSWSSPTVGGRTATSVQATGIGSFSDFALAEADSFAITASAGANGVLSPDGVVRVANGADQAFTITPDAGYHVADVLVDAVSVGALTSYTFTNVTAAHTIAASFAVDTYTIAASAGANGAISPSGAVPVNHGADQAFTITPDAGWEVGDVLVDAVSVGAVASYTFTNVTAAHTIAASFVAGPAVISAVSPSGTLSSTTATLLVPVTLSRVDATANRLFHVTFQLGGGLTLAGGTGAITEGDYLSSGGATTFLQVTDEGGGSYTVDGTILGAPCNNVATTGTLFTIPVTGSTGSGSGSVTLVGTTLRDCDNATLASVAGDTASVAFDYTAPTVAVTAPNGGENWVAGSPQTITWTASDDDSVATVDLFFSPDDGATWPDTIVTGLANDGSHAWTVPLTLTSTARVRAVARDVHGNAASDDGDAAFTIGQWTLTASAGPGGSITPSGSVGVNHGASQAFTMTPDAGQHVADVLVDAVSVGAVAGYTFTNVTSDHTIAASFAANPPVAALTLTASQVRAGNDTDGTTQVLLGWNAIPASSSVAVYRAPYGQYPEFDDLGGAPPAVPTYPPGGPWALTSVTASGTTDEVASRDFWYYVAFVTDTFGTVSPASNVTGGVLNYHLGDVTDGVTLGQGDNAVNILDVSLLGSHYGLTGAAVTAYHYLDVGPTTNASVLARPTTDNRIDFEDLVLFAINYQLVTTPQTAARRAHVAAAADEVTLSGADAFGSDGRWTARVHLRGTGRMQGLSARLRWDAAVVTLESYAPGVLADDLGAIVLSGDPGVIDVATLGVGEGLVGEGDVAHVTFRRIGPGDPAIALAEVEARDAGNVTVPVAIHSPVTPQAPLATTFARIAPNPFRTNSSLSFALAHEGAVELALFSVDGRMVRRLVHGSREAGQYQVAWDGRGEDGAQVPSGVYYARLVTLQGTFQRSLVYLR